MYTRPFGDLINKTRELSGNCYKLIKNEKFGNRRLSDNCVHGLMSRYVVS